MPGALRRCLTSAAAAVSAGALPCPLALPPPPTSGFPPKDATTRPLNLLVHCLPSPAFPPWAGDVAGPLSSEGAQARHLGLISNAAALCERQVDAVFRLSLDVAAIERERERERRCGERSCRVYVGVAGEQRPGVHELTRRGLPAGHNSARRLHLPEVRQGCRGR